jgi:hypothetical protein
MQITESYGTAHHDSHHGAVGKENPIYRAVIEMEKMVLITWVSAHTVPVLQVRLSPPHKSTVMVTALHTGTVLL